MISVHLADLADQDGARRWEPLVQASPTSGVMQSLSWAAFKQARGMEVMHLLVEDAGELIGGALAYRAADPRHPNLITMPEGPVLPWDQPERARSGLRAMRDALRDLVPDAVGLRIEPLLPAPRPALLRDWGRAPVDQLAPETLWLDVRPAPTAVLAQMRPKGRYNIRLAARRGVVTRSTLDAQAIPAFYALLEEAGERDDFYVEPIDYFNDLLRILGPAGHAQILFAERDAEPLAAMLLITYGQRAVYLYGGIATRQRNLMAGYALQWAAINAAREAGCAIYDFYGYESSGDPDHQFAGFSRFKRAFGGTPVAFAGAHDFFWPERVADAVIRAIHELSKEVR